MSDQPPDERVMVRFTAADRRFTFRVGAIIIDSARVLCERGRSEAEPFWFLPGGRAELGECARESLAREMREELGLDVQVGRLVYLMEYFFGYDGRRYHELGMYFAVELPAGSAMLGEQAPFTRMDGDVELMFEWLPVASLRDGMIYPTFFNAALGALPAATEHVVVTDDWAPP